MVEQTILAVEMVNVKRKYKYSIDKNNNDDDWNVFFEDEINFLITLFNNRRKWWVKPLYIQPSKQ